MLLCLVLLGNIMRDWKLHLLWNFVVGIRSVHMNTAPAVNNGFHEADSDIQF